MYMLEDGDVYALPASRDSWPTTSDQMAFHLFWASLSLLQSQWYRWY